MPKLKTKKAKLTFKEGIKSILEAHSLHLEQETLEPLLLDLQEYFNNVYKPDDTVMHFPQLVAQYMTKFEEVTEGEKASFTPIMAINLKRLSKTLQKRFMDKNPSGIWDLQSCLTQHAIYYEMILIIPFMRQNFTPTMMYSRHNENVSYLADQRKKEKEKKKEVFE